MKFDISKVLILDKYEISLLILALQMSRECMTELQQERADKLEVKLRESV